MAGESSNTLFEPARRLELALSYCNLGDWTWDLATDRMQLSPRAAAIFGIDRGAILTRTALRRLLHPDDRERTSIAIETALAGPSDCQIEYRFLREGGIRWIRALGRPVLGDDGVPVGMIGIVQDVTEEKLAQDRLNESEQRFRLMADEAPVMIWVTEADGNCTYVNRQWRDLTGTTMEECLGSGWLTAIHPDDRAHAKAAFVHANRHHETYRIEVRLRRRDGTWRWALDSAAPRFSADGTFLGYIGSVIDISEHKAYEEAIRASEERFRTLVHTIPQLVWTCLPNGYCDFLSQQWVDYTGLPEAEQLGYAWLDRLHLDDRARVFEDWTKAVQESGIFDTEFRIRRHDGVYRWFRTRAIAMRDQEGAIVRWIGTNTDVEELKSTEHELLRANDDLNQFAYSASHDLQEPLRTMTLYSQLLKKRYGDSLPGGALELVDVMELAGRRMSLLIHDLLLYTQAGGGDPRQAPPVDAGSVLEESLRSLKSALEAEKAVVTADRLPLVPIQPAHLQLVLLNLITNAIKYRRPGVAPQIRIAAARADDFWLFRLTDNGLGIDPAYHERIFGLFKRLHGAQYPGTGLGLAICRKIIERYGGRIWVNSEPGNGAEFCFTLPVSGLVRSRKESTE